MYAGFLAASRDYISEPVRPSFRSSLRPLVRDDQVEKCEKAHFRCCVCVIKGVWKGVVRPCSPLCDDIFTLR